MENKDTVWKLISVLCLSALIGGAIERGVFASSVAEADDLVATQKSIEILVQKVDNITQRLSRLEGKLDIALDHSPSKRSSRAESSQE